MIEERLVRLRKAPPPEFVERLYMRLVLGPHTTAQKRELGEAKEPRPLPQDVWHIRTDIAGFGGRVPPGTEPVVRSFASLEAAEAQVGFHLTEPTLLPEGYALREVLVPPVRGATVVLIYRGPGHDLFLAETPVGRQASGATASHTTQQVNSVGVITHGTLEQIDLDGQPAGWIDGHSLVWEAADRSYNLGGLDLTLEQAKTIARSVR